MEENKKKRLFKKKLIIHLHEAKISGRAGDVSTCWSKALQPVSKELHRDACETRSQQRWQISCLSRAAASLLKGWMKMTPTRGRGNAAKASRSLLLRVCLLHCISRHTKLLPLDLAIRGSVLQHNLHLALLLPESTHAFSLCASDLHQTEGTSSSIKTNAKI